MKKKLIITILIVSAVILVLVLVYFLHPHNYSIVNHSDATCTVPESTEYKCWCGASYIEEGDVIPHDYIIKETIEATTDSESYIIYSCSKCGDEYTEQTPKIDKASGLFEDASAEKQDLEMNYDAEEIIEDEPEVTPTPVPESAKESSTGDETYKQYVKPEHLDTLIASGARDYNSIDAINSTIEELKKEGCTDAEIEQWFEDAYEIEIKWDELKSNTNENSSGAMFEVKQTAPPKSSTTTQSTPSTDTSNYVSTLPAPDDSTVGNDFTEELNCY